MRDPPLRRLDLGRKAARKPISRGFDTLWPAPARGPGQPAIMLWAQDRQAKAAGGPPVPADGQGDQKRRRRLGMGHR